MNSFDVFDTLIARMVKEPVDIFKIIEEKYPFNNFCTLRINSERKSTLKNLDEIYKIFRDITNISEEESEKLKQYELDTEYEYSIPIQSNINLVKEGDIYISDMYLSTEQIYRLLNKHKININNKLYVSYGGKHTGSMYNYLINNLNYKINKHHGDNLHSDIKMANKYNIEAIHTNISNFTFFENELYEWSKHMPIVNIFRNVRLENPYLINSLEHNIYNEQISLNIPLLIHICINLDSICSSENIKRILFLTRDSCFIIQIFQIMFPNYESISFNSSRVINKSNNSNYIKYIKLNYIKGETIIFDVCGSFSSGRKIWYDALGFYPRVHIYHWHSNLGTHLDTITYFQVNNTDFTEHTNIDYVGTLINITDDMNFIRGVPEIKFRYWKIINCALQSFLKNLSNICETKMTIIKSVPLKIWINVSKNNKNYNFALKKINKSIKIINSDTDSLSVLASKMKLKTESCNYLKYYEIIFDDIYNKKVFIDVKMLVLGISNQNDNSSINNLLLWNTYAHGNIEIYALDYNTKYKNIKYPNDNIHIFVSDISQDGLDKCKFQNNLYHIMIDHNIITQNSFQTRFVQLWKNVEQGGVYVLENVCFSEWKNVNNNDYLSDKVNIRPHHYIEFLDFLGIENEFANLIKDEINNVFIYTNTIYKSKKIVFIYKNK